MGFDSADLNKGISEINRKLSSLDTQIRKTGAGGSPGIDRIQRDALKATGALTMLQSGLGKLQGILGPMSEAFTVGLTVPLGLVGRAAFNAFTQLDSTRRGMEAILGSASAASRHIEELRTLALSPGLDFNTATQGFRRLVAAGIDTNTATAAVRELGNALALVGGTSDDLAGVSLALQQIASKTKVSAEEINQIAERIPSIRRLMVQAFGTADTEKLQKQGILPKDFIKAIVREAETLPRAASGIANEVKNARDQIYQVLQEVGSDIASVLLPYLKQGAVAIKEFAQAFKALDPATRETIVKFSLLALAIGPVLYALNLARGVLKSMVEGYMMIVSGIKALLTVMGAETLAVNAETAAYERLAIAKTHAAVSGVGGGVSRVAGTVATESFDEIIKLRRASLARVTATVAAEQAMRQAFENSPNGLGAVGNGRDSAKILATAAARLREAEAMKLMADIQARGAVTSATLGAETVQTTSRLAMLGRTAGVVGTALKAALLSPATIATATFVLVKGFGDILLSSSNVANMTKHMDDKYKNLNVQLGYTSAFNGKIIDEHGMLIDKVSTLNTLYGQTEEQLKKVNEQNRQAKAFYDSFYDVNKVDPRAAVTHNGGGILTRKTDPWGAVASYLTNPDSKITKPEDKPETPEDAEAKRLRERQTDMLRGTKFDLLKSQIEAYTAAENKLASVDQLRIDRIMEKLKLVQEQKDAFTSEARAAFDLATEYRVLELQATLLAKSKRILFDINAKSSEGFTKSSADVAEAMHDEMETSGNAYTFQLKQQAEALKEIKEGLDAKGKAIALGQKRIVSAELLGEDAKQSGLESQKSQALAVAEMYADVGLRGQLALEQSRLDIVADYSKRKLDIELKRIDIEYQYEKQTDELKLEIQQKRDAARAASQADIDAAISDAQIRSMRAVRAEALRQFNSIKEGAGRVFDALISRTQSFGDAIKAILRTALLTPLREFTSNWVATMMTGGGRGQARGGGIMGMITGAASMAGGGSFGGVTTPPFVAGAAGAGAGAGGAAPLTGAAGVAAKLGYGGLYGATGITTSGIAALGLGTGALGMLGAFKAGRSGNSALKASAPVIGAVGGLMAFGGLAALFPALIAAGPVGWIAAAGIGAAVGIMGMLKKTTEQKMRDAIKKSYGVDIKDRGVLKQLTDLAKSKYGGNIGLTVQSKEVREIAQLYAASTGQTYRGPATETQQTTLLQSGGQIFQAPGIGSLSQTLPSFGGSIPMLGGATSAGSGYGQSLVLNVSLDGQATTDVLRGEAVTVIIDNPRLIAQSAASASSQNWGRRDVAVDSLSPGLLLA